MLRESIILNHLLGQWLNFTLFGITYLVRKIKFKRFFSGSIGWVRPWSNSYSPRKHLKVSTSIVSTLTLQLVLNKNVNKTTCRSTKEETPAKSTTRWWQLKYFWNFHPYLGKIPILTNIFQTGWNHQLDKVWGCCQQKLRHQNDNIAVLGILLMEKIRLTSWYYGKHAVVYRVS